MVLEGRIYVVMVIVEELFSCWGVVLQRFLFVKALFGPISNRVNTVLRVRDYFSISRNSHYV